MQARDQRVLDWCLARRIPLVLLMAGGYGVQIEETVRVQLNTYQSAFAHWQRW
jgi:hypothetical protein